MKDIGKKEKGVTEKKLLLVFELASNVKEGPPQIILLSIIIKQSIRISLYTEKIGEKKYVRHDS